MRQQQALIEPVDRPARDSDVVVLDLHGRLADAPEGEDQALMDEHGISILVAESTDFPFPGSAVHLLGIGVGEERDAEYTFPADYRNESLRGRKAIFHFRCQAVKSRSVPEWSDELARNLGEFTDQSDLRLKVRQSLEGQSLQQAESDYADKVIDAVVSGSQLAFPPVLLRQEVDDTLQDLDRRLKDQRLSLTDYLKIEKKDESELRLELEPQARRRLERGLVLGQVVEAENLEVEESEVGAALDRILEPLSESKDAVRQRPRYAGRPHGASDSICSPIKPWHASCKSPAERRLPSRKRARTSSAQPKSRLWRAMPPAPAEVQAASQGGGSS